MAHLTVFYAINSMGVSRNYLPQIPIFHREVEARACIQLTHVRAVQLLPR